MKTIQEEKKKKLCIRNSCIDLEEQGAWPIQIKERWSCSNESILHEIGKILQNISLDDGKPSQLSIVSC